MSLQRRMLLAAALPPSWAAGWAWAQPRQRVGFLAIGDPALSKHLVLAQTEGLRELGFVDGRNVALDYRWIGRAMTALPTVAAELAALPVDVMVASTNGAIAAAQQATSTIPIVMVLDVDPVRNGFIDSFARPGRNITGLTNEASPDVRGKMLSMLKELVPKATLVGVLLQQGLAFDPASLRDAARLLGLQLIIAPEVREQQDIEPAFEALRRAGVQACFVVGGSLIYAHRQQVAELELRHRLPAIHYSADYVRAGGLLSYGTDLVAQFRRSASFIARILNGAKPAEMPVEQPARFETVINLATARALGLTVPPSLLLRADEVIQ